MSDVTCEVSHRLSKSNASIELGVGVLHSKWVKDLFEWRSLAVVFFYLEYWFHALKKGKHESLTLLTLVYSNVQVCSIQLTDWCFWDSLLEMLNNCCSTVVQDQFSHKESTVYLSASLDFVIELGQAPKLRKLFMHINGKHSLSLIDCIFNLIKQNLDLFKVSDESIFICQDRKTKHELVHVKIKLNIKTLSILSPNLI